VSRPSDPFGTLVAVVLAAMIALFAVALFMWMRSVNTERVAYEKCVADIPGYLDAQEILYQEQECNHG
jgi:hypothetical protein